MDSTDSAVNLSLDDLTGFAQPLGGSIGSGGMGQADNSFDASMDGSASFLSGADMSTDPFDLDEEVNTGSLEVCAKEASCVGVELPVNRLLSYLDLDTRVSPKTQNIF